MEYQPLISIVMPAFHAEKYIRQAIDSILQQIYKNWELLICDDCSADNTASIISSYSDHRIKSIRNTSNMGYLKVCNKLFAQCKGEFITFQDADDYSSPHRLEKLIAAFQKSPDVMMIGSYARIVDESGKFIRNDERKLNYVEILQKLPMTSQFNGATVMIKRKVFEYIGGYREYFNDYAYQDYDWTFRIAENFVSINIPEYLYFYRQQPAGNSKKISPKRAISHELVQWLAKDRVKNKNDYLDRREVHVVDEFVKQKLFPYCNDPSLIYREYAGIFMYNKLYRQAIYASIGAVRHRPLRFINYRTLFYCLRKSMMN